MESCERRRRTGMAVKHTPIWGNHKSSVYKKKKKKKKKNYFKKIYYFN